MSSVIFFHNLFFSWHFEGLGSCKRAWLATRRTSLKICTRWSVGYCGALSQNNIHVFKPEFWIRICFLRIRIQHFKMNTDWFQIHHSKLIGTVWIRIQIKRYIVTRIKADIFKKYYFYIFKVKNCCTCTETCCLMSYHIITDPDPDLAEPIIYGSNWILICSTPLEHGTYTTDLDPDPTFRFIRIQILFRASLIL